MMAGNLGNTLSLKFRVLNFVRGQAFGEKGQVRVLGLEGYFTGPFDIPLLITNNPRRSAAAFLGTSIMRDGIEV